MNHGAKVVWQGSPAAGPALLTWTAILAIILGISGLLYGYMAATGTCIDLILQENCTHRGRRRMEVIFLVLAAMAAGALAVILRTALGFPHQRYVITATEIRSQSGWPLTGCKVQPLAYVNIQRQGNGLRFTGTGAKPVSFDHLPKGEADRLIALIEGLKAAQAPDIPKGGIT